MKCIGVTKKMKRCKRNCKFLLCDSHKFQWYALIAVILTLVGFFKEIVFPIKSKLFSNFNNEVLLEGSWNDSIVNKSLIKLLLNYNNKDFGYVFKGDENKLGELVHKLIGFYSIHDGTKELTIALYASHPNLNMFSDCHTCGVKISVFEIEEIKKNWEIKNKIINAFEMGRWGNFPEKVVVLTIGYGKYGIIEYQNDDSNGANTESITLYTLLNNKINSVLNLNIHEDTYSYQADKKLLSDWSSDFSFVKEGYGFYDLKVLTKGKNRGIDTLCTNIYKFTGNSYLIDYGLPSRRGL